MMLDSIKGREPYQEMKERAQDRQGWSDYRIWNLLNSSTLQRHVDDLCCLTPIHPIPFPTAAHPIPLTPEHLHISPPWAAATEMSLYHCQRAESRPLGRNIQREYDEVVCSDHGDPRCLVILGHLLIYRHGAVFNKQLNYKIQVID